jgi:autotransporter passenger strand-loop-strand repeat protein
VAGDFELQHGAALSLTGGLTVGGNLNVDTVGNASGSVLGVAGDLTNGGTVNVGTGFNRDGGSTVTIAGNLNNSGALNIHDDTASATVVTAGGLSNTGTINLVGDEFGDGTGAAELILTSGAAPSTLSSTITLFGPSLLEFASGGISSIAGSGKLIVGNAHAFVADSGSTGSNSALTGLSSVAGDFELQYGAALSLSGGLTVGGSLNIDTNGGASGSTLNVAGDLTNNGTVNVGTGFNRDGGSTVTITGNLNNSGTLNIHDDTASATVVTARALTTVGPVNLVGDEFGDGAGAAELILTSGAAPSTLSSTITLFGPSLLEFASGGISSIAASGKLVVGGGQAFVADSGATSSNSALTGLGSVAGDFELQHGAALSLMGGLTVGGNLNVDTVGNASGSVLGVAGDLTNSGTVNVGTGFNRDGGSTVTITGNLNNSGTLNIHDDTASATVVTAGALSNAGTINLVGDEFGDGTGAASLTVSGAASNNGTININSFASLLISGALTGSGNATIGQDAQLAVQGASGGTLTFNGAGASLTLDGRATFSDTISGMTLGDSIILKNTDATGAFLSGQTLTIQLAGGGALAYHLTGNFTGESFATTQVGGNSDITLVAGSDQPPVTTVPGSQTIAAGVVTALSGISVSDAQAVNLNEPISTTLSDASGVFSAYTGVPGGGGSISGAGTNLLTIAGSLAQINADLSTLSILENVAGSDTISVTTSDGRGGSDNHQIAVTVSGTSNAPVPIPNGKTVEVASSANVIFVGTAGILKIDNPQSFNGTIAGVGLGDTIDFKNTTVTAATINGGTLSITESGGPTLNYTISGALSGNYFAITSDGNNGSKLVLSTIVSAAAQYYTDFRPAFASLQTAVMNGAGASAVAAAIINVYNATITDALTVIGNAGWGSTYGGSGQAATTLRTALANGATSAQVLTDTVNLYGTIIAGAVSVFAGGGSQQVYQKVSAAAATLGSDISQSASQIQSDLTALYSAIKAGASGAINPSAWQTAQNQSANDAQTLSTDMSNGASSARILSDVSTLYDSIVSGSLNAIGGNALQQAYTGGGETILKLGTDIGSSSGNSVVSDVAGLYNAVATTVAAPTVGSTAIQNYQNAVSAANALLADAPNSFSPVRIANDGTGLFQSVLADILATVYGENAEQAYRQTLQEQAQVDLDLGSNAPLAKYKTDESALANNTVAGWMAALGGSDMQQAYNAALQTYNTLKADAFGNPPASGAQTQTDAAAADAAIVSVVDLIDSNAQTNFSAALIGDAQTLDQFWQSSESSGQNYFQNLANQIIQYQNAFNQNYQLFSTDLQNNGGIESSQDLGYARQMVAEQGSLTQLTAAFFVGSEEGPRGGVDVQSFGSDLAGPTNGPDPNDPGPPADPPPDDGWDEMGGPAGPAPPGSMLPPGSSSGGWWGDAHLTTYDGLNYNFQAEGEFIVSKSLIAGDSFQVQARLQPWRSSSSVSVTTQIAASVGTDRVTFGVGRADTVWINGDPSTLSAASPVVNLNGGTLLELSADSYEIKWNTGEVLAVTDSGSYLNISIGLPTNLYPGSVEGLLGPNGEGQANDFQLADGTVLPQPLTSGELYGEFANAWRIKQTSSLLDYGTGQTTATFTDMNFPADAVSLANLPPSVVDQATTAVTAAGVTNPTLVSDAVLDYIATGDPTFIADAANVQRQGIAITPTAVTQPTPTLAIGVNPVESGVVVSSSGTTDVAFNVYLTSAATADTTVEYQVVAPGLGYFDAAAFGGTLPSGQVVIPQNQTATQFTITLPQGAVGSLPSENLEVLISAPSGQPLFAPTATAVVVNSQAEPGAPAIPTLAQVTPLGTLTQSGNAYTLNIGTLMQGVAVPNFILALNNAATPPADELGGVFSVGTGSGFAISTTGSITPLAAGQSDWFYVTADTSKVGSNSETFTFAATDVNASGYSANLPNQTLTITDTVEAAAQATVDTPSEVTLPNVRVGATDEEPLSVTNATPAPGAALDASVFMINNATGSGTITDLGAGATDDTDIQIGVTTATAGPKKGDVTLSLASDAGNGNKSALPNQFVEVFGGVYRPASPFVAPILVQVGNSTAHLSITNSDPADGYSENLIASVVSSTGGVTASGTTGDIAAQATNNTITLGASAASAGTIGTVTLDFTTDGTGIDGLGSADLGEQTFSVSALVQLVDVSSGATSAGVGVVSGGVLEVLFGGIASGATISSGGSEIVIAGGSDLDTKVSGGKDDVFGYASAATILTGSLAVESGGIAVATTVSGSGALNVLSGGIALSTVAQGKTSALVVVSSGGRASATSVGGGGFEIVSAGGVANGAIVGSGGTEDIRSGGTSIGATIKSGGIESIGATSGGGVASSTIVSGGGRVFVSSGGITVAALVSGNAASGSGTETVFAGGTASSTTVSGTAALLVSSGGLALGTVVGGNSFGGLIISAGGTASGTTLASGFEEVQSTGIDNGTTILGGGSEFVASGGTAGGTIISGGTAELANGAIAASGGITFAGVGGDLRIDGTTSRSMPTAVISGWRPGDTIDLTSVSFSTSGSITLKSGNVLEIKENGSTCDFNLDPSQNFAGWDLKLSSDGATGTNIRLGGQTDDFDFDRTSDILFRNDTSGDTWVELISNGAFASWQQIGGSNTSYAEVGVGDFYGAGTADALFRNNTTGDTWVETISDAGFVSWNQIGGSDTHYSVVGVADFYGNATDDILFRNNSTGDTWFEAISNGAFASWNQIGGSNTSYAVVGVGDFFGNGTDDILFRNTSTGDTWIEAISNGAFAAWDQIGGSNTSYAVVGVGDFFGNGTDDVLFRNNSTGDTWIEAISNDAFNGWFQIGGSNTSYAVVGVGDYFGNGTDDILFRNNSTGDTWIEAMSNGAFAGWRQVGGSSTSYTVKT